MVAEKGDGAVKLRGLAAFLAVFLAVVSAGTRADDDGARFTRFLGLRLNYGTLDGVQERLGRSRLIELNDADDYEARVCYLGSRGVVSFISGVPRLELSGFEVREPGTVAAEGCRELHGRLASESVELAGLHLGMSKAEFTAVVGEPVRWDGDSGQRDYESEQKMSGAQRVLFKDSPELLARGTFNVLVSVTGTFVDGHLVGFRVWKVVSV
jgi:hypothetical protein